MNPGIGMNYCWPENNGFWAYSVLPDIPASIPFYPAAICGIIGNPPMPPMNGF